MTTRPVDRAAPHRVAIPVMHQTWSTLTFLHWSFAASDLADLVAPPMTLDTFDGRAWVGLTPFVLRDLRPPGLPPLPWIGHGPETNVRTYVRAPNGRTGIVFLSLDIVRFPAVIAARTAYRLPYMWATATARRERTISYRGHRRWGGRPAAWDIAVTPGAATSEGDVTELDNFLTARWWLFARYGRRWAATPAEHEPWPLRRATVDHLDESLLAAAGLRRPDDPPLVHVSPGVHARIGLTRPV